MSMTQNASQIRSFIKKKSLQILFGKHSVLCALQASKRPIQMMIVREDIQLESLLNLARDKEISTLFKPKTVLDNLCGTTKHQGVLCLLSELTKMNYESLDLDSISRLVLINKIKDPMNLGAVLRSAHFFGLNDVLVPNRYSCSLSATACKASAGAMEFVNIYRIANTLQVLEDLKTKGWKVVVTSQVNCPNSCDANQLREISKYIIVFGEEHSGVEDGIMKISDYNLTIKSSNSNRFVDCLNVSVAAAKFSEALSGRIKIQYV